MREVSPIEKYILEKESEQIGGMLVLLMGEQGAGKTVAMTKMVMKDMGIDQTHQEFDPNKTRRIPLWKGQESCQWILLAANNLPITLWMHESITDYEFYLTGSKQKDIKKRVLDLEELEGLDVEIKEYSNQEELVENLETKRVNVYYIPGAKGNHQEKYFYQKQTYFLDKALNERDYGDHITVNRDEISNEASTLRKGDFYELQEYQLPSQWEDFRKKKVSLRGAGHDTSDINYKLWKVKLTGMIYMQGAQVASKHREIDQRAVNKLKRGQFVVPGFEPGEFTIPKMPQKSFDWMPETNEVRLQCELEADIPDIRPNNVNVEDWIEQQPFSKNHLDDLIDADEASEITDYASRVVKRKFQNNEIPAVKLNGKWFTSMTALVNETDVPS